MKKRLPVLLLALVMVFSISIAAFGCDKVESMDAVSGGKVLRIRCWNDEFQSRFRSFYPDVNSEKSGEGVDYLTDGTKIEWVIVANQNNAYQIALDTALKAQDEKKREDRVDMFLIEADYASKYVDSEYSLDIKKDVGLTDNLLKDQYEYTQTIVTDKNNKLKATSWQAAPGLYAYRRDIAKEVFETDDPDVIQEKVSDWVKFEETAATMKENGYYMLSGFDDSFRVFSNNMTGKWVKDDNKTINEDAAINNWIKQTKDFSEKGYNNGTTLWDENWQKGQGPEGKVFGYFYSTWGINFTLLGNSLADKNKPEEEGNGLYGKWAVCPGPQAYYWGGTWLCAAAGTDNVTLIRDIMYHLTCNKDTMKAITADVKIQDFTNNKAAMAELAVGYESAFLGGQNHIQMFLEAADKIDMSNISPYDQGCNEKIQGAMADYFKGTISLDKAWANFYTNIKETYPQLQKAS